MSTYTFTLPSAPGATPSTNPSAVIPPLGEAVDHEALGVARLKEQDKGKTYIDTLLRLLLSEFSEIETAYLDILLKRSVDTAEGDQLDVLGYIVGENRNGSSDTNYRQRIRARIIASRSRGTGPEVLNLARFIVGDAYTIVYDNQGGGTYVIRIDDGVLDATSSQVLIDFLRLATLAGVRVIVEIAADVDSASFTTAIFTSLSAGIGIGVTILPVVSTAGFPTTGQVDLDYGLPTQETVTYSGVTATSFTGVLTTQTHIIEAGVTKTSPAGQGFGTTSNPAIGGKLARARDF